MEAVAVAGSRDGKPPYDGKGISDGVEGILEFDCIPSFRKRFGVEA
jgi:hypothetical protein